MDGTSGNRDCSRCHFCVLRSLNGGRLTVEDIISFVEWVEKEVADEEAAALSQPAAPPPTPATMPTASTAEPSVPLLSIAADPLSSSSVPPLLNLDDDTGRLECEEDDDLPC